MTQDNAPARDWAAMGITWQSRPVHRHPDGNKATQVHIGDAQLPIMADLEKFRAHFGDTRVADFINGTALTVRAQDVNRTALEKRNGVTVEQLREAVYARLMGARGSSVRTVEVVRTVTVAMLPGGGTYDGTDEVEYQQAYAAALVDGGMDSATAMAVARTMKLAK